MITSIFSDTPIEAIFEKPRVDIEAMVKFRLPLLPGSALRIFEILRDFNTPSKKVADAIGYDPLLTTHILRFANSPIFALQRNVHSLTQAVEVVGTKFLKEIVMISMTANSFSSEIRTSAMGRTIWIHSLAVALLCRELSRMLGMRGTEEVFICGLLHDIGKIMLLRADVETYTQVLDIKSETEMLNWEAKTYGFNHAQVGGLVIRRWQLPNNICNVVLNHHNISQAIESVQTLNIISIADTMANYHGFGLRLESESALQNSDAALVLNLTESQIHEAWENIQSELGEVTETFK